MFVSFVPQNWAVMELMLQWNDDFHHSLRTVLTKESGGYYADFGSYEQLAKAYQNTFCLRWGIFPFS